MTDKHRQTEGWGGRGRPSSFPSPWGKSHPPALLGLDGFSPAMAGVNRLGQLSSGSQVQGERQDGEAGHLSRRLPSNRREGDLAHYRGGRRIKVSRGWELGVDTEDAVPLETACLVLGDRGPLLGLGDSPLRGNGVLSSPITLRVGVRIEKPFLHVDCVSHTFCRWPCFTFPAAWSSM